MRQLLIDIGNGRIKIGLAEAECVTRRAELLTPGVTAEQIAALLAEGWHFDQSVLCSVVPAAVPAFRKVLGASLIELRHDTPLGIGIDYPHPESIGADRLANAVALARLHGAPGIVIDFGTAVTFDIVSAERAYVGGVIAPGLRLMTDYLHERTALLPKVALREPEQAIGKSTEQAILAGAAIGYRGMVKGILDALRRELGSGTIHLVATGGDAKWIVSGLDEVIACDPDLTLHGLRLTGELQAASRARTAQPTRD